MIQTYFMLSLFARFAITHAAILLTWGRVRCYALTDLHVVKLIDSARIWDRLHRIFV